jgi:hypothetical protein
MNETPGDSGEPRVWGIPTNSQDHFPKEPLVGHDLLSPGYHSDTAIATRKRKDDEPQMLVGHNLEHSQRKPLWGGDSAALPRFSSSRGIKLVRQYTGGGYYHEGPVYFCGYLSAFHHEGFFSLPGVDRDA